MKATPQLNEVKETGRIEAISDGIIAIAITLLILEIRVPHVEGAGELLPALSALWPSYLAYFISFATIGVMWINHHRLFRLIVRTDNTFTTLNLVLMMMITFVNFPTALLADYIQHPDAQVAVLVYSGTLFATAVVFNVLWRYLRGQRGLLSATADEGVIRGVTRAYNLGLALYLTAFLAAFVSPGLSLLLNALLAIYFLIPARG